MKKIAILGSTGSIGTQTLDVVREHSDELQVVALAAGSNKERLKEQIKEFHPKLVSLSDAVSYTHLTLPTICSV